MISKKVKSEVISEVKKEVAQAGSVVFVNFHGLDVAKTTNLRRELKEKGVGYKVVKKTLLRRAIDDSTKEVAIAGEMPELPGEIAIAYGVAQFSPAKGVYDFQTKVKEGLKIIGGIFDHKFISGEEMTKIAMIPSREVLYGQLVGMLAFPMRGLVVTLDQISKSKSN